MLTRTWSNIIYEMDEKLLLQLNLEHGVICIYSIGYIIDICLAYLID